MNSTLPIHVEVIYSPEILEAAAKCFIRQYFRAKGRWLLAACAVNALGLGAAVALGARDTFIIAAVVFIVVIGPLYCAYLYTLFPRRYAARIARHLPPTTGISFTASTVEIPAKEHTARIPWSSIKEVWECPGAFLLVFSQFAVVFIVVPKNHLPPSAYAFLAGKVREHAA
jgi:hypothetical protein